MARRPKQPTGHLEVSASLSERLVAEGHQFDRSTPGHRRLLSAGVVEISTEPEAGPTAIAWRSTALGGWFDIDPSHAEPFSDALKRLIATVPKIDELRRLLIAWTDFELAGEAAGLLADRSTDADSSLPVILREVVEAGLVVLYTRNYTGHAKLGEKWKPADRVDRAIHDDLMERRNRIVAHADRNEDRTLVDVNRELGIPGPPAIVEQRAHLPEPRLREIAGLCIRQAERLHEATWHLKRELGIPVAGG